MAKLSEKFRALRSDINGEAPTAERVRDWCATLADLCEGLAIAAEKKEPQEQPRGELSYPVEVPVERRLCPDCNWDFEINYPYSLPLLCPVCECEVEPW